MKRVRRHRAAVTALAGTVALISTTGVMVAGAGPAPAETTLTDTQTTLVAGTGQLTATVSAEGQPVASGQVRFALAGDVLGTVDLLNGTAVWTQAPPAGSTETEITASFTGTGTLRESSDVAEREVADPPILDVETATDGVVGTTLQVGVDPSVDGDSVALAVAVEDSDASASAPCAVVGTRSVSLDHAGSCVLAAVQAGTWISTGSQEALHVEVYPTTTTTSVSVAATRLTTTVEADEPSGHIPGGTVQFLVNETPVGAPVPLLNGRAVLQHTLRTGADWDITATYGGSDDAEGSEDYTSRTDPFIDAYASSAAPRKAGWYRKPVRVRFECEENGAALNPCPAAKTVTASGAKQVVRGTVTAVDGGAASASVTISLDRNAPSIALKGVKNRGTVKAKKQPKPTCTARDTLSGIAKKCTLTQRVVKKAGKKTTISFTATASDKAGNTAKVTGKYTWVKK